MFTFNFKDFVIKNVIEELCNFCIKQYLSCTILIILFYTHTGRTTFDMLHLLSLVSISIFHSTVQVLDLLGDNNYTVKKDVTECLSHVRVTFRIVLIKIFAKTLHVSIRFLGLVGFIKTFSC